MEYVAVHVSGGEFYHYGVLGMKWDVRHDRKTRLGDRIHNQMRSATAKYPKATMAVARRTSGFARSVQKTAKMVTKAAHTDVAREKLAYDSVRETHRIAKKRRAGTLTRQEAERIDREYGRRVAIAYGNVRANSFVRQQRAFDYNQQAFQNYAVNTAVVTNPRVMGF